MDLDDADQAALSDDVLQLSERTAVQLFFDEFNRRRLTFQVWVLTSVVVIYAVVMFFNGSQFRGLVAGLVVVADLALLRFRRAQSVQRSIRQVLAAVLLGHFALFLLVHGTESGGAEFWIVAFAVAAARFRLSNGETMILFGTLYGVAAIRLFVVGLLSKQGPPIGSMIGFAVFYAAVMAAALLVSQRQRNRFLGRWRAESGRQRERLRMKQELEYARKIQLSMLPREAPRLRWLDIAALSLPATEVGGDYYDYFPLGEDRLALVVGDVTGHGVASGLVLSGVRSSLNLLQDELTHPRRIFGRVNRMLKKTSARHMLMTLGLVVLDRRSSTAIVATAGHPPVMVRRNDGSVKEVGLGSLPLGALAAATYEEQRVELEPGDVLLVYSDGLVETTDPYGAQYGFDRLREAMRVVDGRSARARDIRDAVLRDVWDFKKDAEQVDDVTMVAVRVREAGGKTDSAGDGQV